MIENAKIRKYDAGDRDSLIRLWTEVFPAGLPHNDPHTSLDKKLRIDRDLLLVSVIDDMVIGSVIGGYDGRRGWIYSLAVKPGFRRQGIATKLMRAVEKALVERGCLKVNLQIVASNAGVVALYEKLGFSVEERISMGKKLYD